MRVISVLFRKIGTCTNFSSCIKLYTLFIPKKWPSDHIFGMTFGSDTNCR